MTTLTIRIPDEEAERFSGIIEKMGGEIVSSGLTKEELRQETLQELKEGLNEAFDIIEGGKQNVNL